MPGSDGAIVALAIMVRLEIPKTAIVVAVPGDAEASCVLSDDIGGFSFVCGRAG
ncbi:hypothetical protein [Yoonia sp. SS1-5]|uniref:Uncharacterized protein n=1 Tax=Yoonia rhodophyticola TaxID=3137370 RepID=A0AAN0MDK6_9RHOB